MDSVQLTDGSTTIDLNDGSSYQLINWHPSYDGVESIRFQVLGTAAQIAARVRAVENALMLVKRRDLQEVGDRWYVQWQPSGLSTEVEARLLYDKDDPNRLKPVDRQSRKWELKVHREPFWRGAETTVPLTNGHGTDVTAGLQVDNTDDSSRDNWVEIDGDDVDGDMPALTRMILENSYNDAQGLRDVRFGLRTESDRFDKFVLEDNEVTSGEGSVVGGSYSGGTRREGSGGTGVSYPGTWEISSGDAKKWAGLWRFLTRCSFPDEVWMGAYADLSYTERLMLGTEPTACSSDDLTDLGLMQIPPWPEPEDDASESFLVKLLRSGTGSWWFDYVMLIPVGEGYRKVWYEEDAAPYQEFLVDDGILDEAAQGDATRAGVVRAEGRRIALVPGVDQRIYFSMVGNSGDAAIDRTVDVVIEIVPRYRFFED